MTIKVQDRQPRRRRVASDEAHAWARNLRLGNPYAKSVLRAVALYTNDEGSCFAGISTLAEDSDLSEDTVRKRLKFLEDIGAIVRFANWIDDRGRRNSEGRGKRTTDDIRLLLDADPEAIEARARGENGANDEADTSEISPRQQQGLNSAADEVSPRPAPGQPPHSGEGLISEPEPEISPQPPSGGVCDQALQGKDEAHPASVPEHFAGFFEGCLGWRTMDRERALVAFRLLSADVQGRARAASALHAEECAKYKRRSKDAHKLLAERFWERYPNAKLPEKPPERVWVSDPRELQAVRLAYQLADRPPPQPVRDETGGVGLWRLVPVGADLLKLLTAPSRDAWSIAKADTAEFNAWRSRIHAWTSVWVEAQKIWLEPFNEAVHGLPAAHEDFRMRKAAWGLKVPWAFPPGKDGKIYGDERQTTEGEAS